MPLLVSIRAPAWGETLGWLRSTDPNQFQFALPRGERRAIKAQQAEIEVSIRAPAWGATAATLLLVRSTAFQFALPRGERHCLLVRLLLDADVSIRAPAWGATQMPWRSVYLEKFQFALPRGERRRCRQSSFCPASFNSRSRVGSDPALSLSSAQIQCFNSRSRVGSDAFCRVLYLAR